MFKYKVCLCRFATGFWVLMNSRMSVVTLQELFPSIIFPWQSKSLGRREKKTTDKCYNIFSSPIQGKRLRRRCRMYLITEFQTRKSQRQNEGEFLHFLDALYLSVFLLLIKKSNQAVSFGTHFNICCHHKHCYCLYHHEWCSKTNSEPTTIIAKRFWRILKSTKPNQFKLRVEKHFSPTGSTQITPPRLETTKAPKKSSHFLFPLDR